MPSLLGSKPNQVSTNGELGTLAFQDSNAVNITGGVVDVSAGTAALPTLGTTGDPNTGVFFPAADTVAVATNGVERVRVDSNGNLGIGTTSPAQKLDVNGNIKVGTNLWIGTTSGASYVADDGVFGGTIFNGGGFKVHTGGTERMRIDASGNVGVGTANPLAKLDVSNKFRVTPSAASNQEILAGTQVDSYNANFSLLPSPATPSTNTVQICAYSPDTGWRSMIETSNKTSGAPNVILAKTSGNVSIGAASPASSAILDVQSTTKGVRMPNMTTTQKNAIASPVAGLMVFDTTLAKLCVYSGSAWETITSI